LADFDSALDPFATTSGDAHPEIIVFPEQSEQLFIQVQRLCFEGQQLHGLLSGFECFVSFRDALAGTDGIISKEVEPLSDLSVSQVVESDGIEASLVERYLADSVAGSGKDIQRSFQTLSVLCRQVKFCDNGQLHCLYYTTQVHLNQNPTFRASEVR
jgi:hypothetical protein